MRVSQSLLAAEVARTQELEAEVARLTGRLAAAAPMIEEQPVQVKIEAATPTNPTLATGSETPRAPAREVVPRALPFEEPAVRRTATAVQQDRGRQLAKAVRPDRFGGSSKGSAELVGCYGELP